MCWSQRSTRFWWSLILLSFILFEVLPPSADSRRNYRRHKGHRHLTGAGKRYHLTLSVRNHNVTEAEFFRLVGVDNTADFYVAPGEIFTHTYQVSRKGAWTLFVEFSGNRYAKSPRKMISRDSYPHWIMEVYFYPGAVGFSEWHKMHKYYYYEKKTP